MSYCSNCGGRLNDNGICPNCGSMSEAKVQPERKNNFEVINCLRAFFSSSPLTGVENVARTKSKSVWVTFGIIFVISSVVTALKAFTSMSAESASILLGSKISNAISLTNSQISEEMLSAFVSLLLYAALMSISLIAVIALITSVIFIFAEEKPSFFQALNITTFSVFPVSVCMLIAALLSFLSIFASLSVFVAGLSISAISYYFGAQKASSFKKSPFWIFFISILSGNVLLGLISIILTNLLF